VADILPLAEAGDGGSVLDATVLRHDEPFQLSVLSSAAGELQVPMLTAPIGAPVRAYIRARDVMLSLRPPEDISALNVLAGTVAAITPLGATSGAQAEVRLDCNGATLIARLTAKSVQRLALAPGRPVYAVIKSVRSSEARRAACPISASASISTTRPARPRQGGAARAHRPRRARSRPPGGR
jgi:molybdate transport system ATP-binding protein